MLILKQKQNTPIFQDELGNTYPDMVVAISYHIDPVYKQMDVQLRYFKDTESMQEKKSPLMISDFVWDDVGFAPTDVDGNPIDWATFMTTVPRETWKDRIQNIGRVPFSQLPAGLDVTVAEFNFAQNPVGQAWKQIMLFLPINERFAQQANIKFLDEVFEYHTV